MKGRGGHNMRRIKRRNPVELEGFDIDVHVFSNGIMCRSERSWDRWPEEAVRELFAHLSEIVLKQRKRIHLVADPMPPLPPS